MALRLKGRGERSWAYNEGRSGGPAERRRRWAADAVVVGGGGGDADVEVDADVGHVKRRAVGGV